MSIYTECGAVAEATRFAKGLIAFQQAQTKGDQAGQKLAGYLVIYRLGVLVLTIADHVAKEKKWDKDTHRQIKVVEKIFRVADLAISLSQSPPDLKSGKITWDEFLEKEGAHVISFVRTHLEHERHMGKEGNETLIKWLRGFEIAGELKLFTLLKTSLSPINAFSTLISLPYPGAAASSGCTLYDCAH